MASSAHEVAVQEKAGLVEPSKVSTCGTKKGTENYQLLLGGSGAEDTSLAKITGPGFDEDGIVDAVETVTNVYLAKRAEGERFLDTYRRVGMEPFKEALYG